MTNKQDKSTVMEVKNISLRFGGVKAIEGISFDILEGEVRAIIGPNGAESLLLNVINGFYHPQEGEVWFNGQKRGPMKPYQMHIEELLELFKTLPFLKGMSTLDNIMTGRFTKMNSGMLSQIIWRGKAEREEYDNRRLSNG